MEKGAEVVEVLMQNGSETSLFTKGKNGVEKIVLTGKNAQVTFKHGAVFVIERKAVIAYTHGVPMAERK